MKRVCIGKLQKVYTELLTLSDMTQITFQNQILSVKHLKEIFFEQFPKKIVRFFNTKNQNGQKIWHIILQAYQLVIIY